MTDFLTIAPGALLITGLVGSASHCVGMCGGFVFAYSASTGETGILRAQSRHLAYHAGRVWTYVLMGATCGLLGQAVMSGTTALASRAIVPIVAGVTMVVLGAAKMGWLRTGSGGAGPLQLLLARLTRRFRSGGSGQLLILGFLNGLLPCGLTYAVLPLSAASGGAVEGGVLMGIFGVGTVPAMWTLGTTTTSLGPRLRGRLFRVAALLVIGLGVVSITRGAQVALTGELSHAGHAGHTASPAAGQHSRHTSP